MEWQSLLGEGCWYQPDSLPSCPSAFGCPGNTFALNRSHTVRCRLLSADGGYF